jgi:hypothetical protein
MESPHHCTSQFSLKAPMGMAEIGAEFVLGEAKKQNHGVEPGRFDGADCLGNALGPGPDNSYGDGPLPAPEEDTDVMHQER